MSIAYNELTNEQSNKMRRMIKIYDISFISQGDKLWKFDCKHCTDNKLKETMMILQASFDSSKEAIGKFKNPLLLGELIDTLDQIIIDSQPSQIEQHCMIAR